MANLMQDRIDPTKRVQLVSDDGKVRIIYNHFEMGSLKFVVQVNIGSKERPYWTSAGYSDSWVPALTTFKRIVADRTRGW